MNTQKKMVEVLTEDHPITFENLPYIIGRVMKSLEEIEMLLLEEDPELTVRPPISTKELCKFLNVTRPTIFRYRQRGIIPYINIGQVIRYDLNKVIAALENKKGGRK